MKKNIKSEFRIYDKINCNLFDLIDGDLEPKQTKALGFLLYKSRVSLNAFLALISFDKLRYDRYIVDCEAQRKQKENNDRIDILLRFYQQDNPVHAFIIEAKSVTSNTSMPTATKQVKRYIHGFPQLRDFNDSDVSTITLTHYAKQYQEGSYALSWIDLINKLHESNSKDSIINDFINFILNIKKSNMHYYEEEILSLPAGDTIEAINQTGIYEYPLEENKTKVKTRNHNRVIYLCFRKSKGSIMETLYKIKDVFDINLGDTDAIEKIDSEIEGFKDRLAIYKSIVKKISSNNLYRVYVLDKENSINLPNPVKPAIPIQGSVYYDLKDFLRQPNSIINGKEEKIVSIQKNITISHNILSIKINKQSKGKQTKTYILQKENGNPLKNFVETDSYTLDPNECVYILHIQENKNKSRLKHIKMKYNKNNSNWDLTFIFE